MRRVPGISIAAESLLNSLKEEYERNQEFRESFEPQVSDNFQIGPDGAYEHEE